MFGEVNRRAREIQRSQFTLGAVGQDHLRCEISGAIGQRPVKGSAALLVGAGLTKDLIVYGHKLDRRVRHGLAVLQRAQGDIEAALALIGGNRQIGQHDPAAGRGGRAFLRAQFRRVRDAHVISARFHRRDHVLQRKDRHDRRVLFGGNLHRT